MITKLRVELAIMSASLLLVDMKLLKLYEQSIQSKVPQNQLHSLKPSELQKKVKGNRQKNRRVLLSVIIY